MMIYRNSLPKLQFNTTQEQMTYNSTYIMVSYLFFIFVFSILVAPAKKRGRAAQPKQPGAPTPPKVPKARKPPKDPNAPKAKPGPKPKKAAQADGKQEKIDETFKKVKRKVDRFKGMSEEEVMKKTLPDLLDYNLDYVIVRFTF